MDKSEMKWVASGVKTRLIQLGYGGSVLVDEPYNIMIPTEILKYDEHGNIVVIGTTKETIMEYDQESFVQALKDSEKREEGLNKVITRLQWEASQRQDQSNAFIAEIKERDEKIARQDKRLSMMATAVNAKYNKDGDDLPSFGAAIEILVATVRFIAETIIVILTMFTMANIITSTEEPAGIELLLVGILLILILIYLKLWYISSVVRVKP